MPNPEFKELRQFFLQLLNIGNETIFLDSHYKYILCAYILFVLSNGDQ